jgi:DNA-binding transcriptional regulator PaaX
MVMTEYERKDLRAKIIDEIIRFSTGGMFVVAGVLLPGTVLAFHKPLAALLGKLDQREREREVRQAMYRMKARGLLVGDYEHGLEITDKARRRLAKIDLDSLELQSTDVWDGKWRIVIYDIPEEHAIARRLLQERLLRYGCIMLQKSTWITPFPCRNDVVALSTYYGVSAYISYFEAVNLDNAPAMIARFKKRFPATTFKIPKNTPIE